MKGEVAEAPFTTSAVYDCVTDTWNCARTWTQARKAWCREMKGIMCAGMKTPATVVPMAAIAAATPAPMMVRDPLEPSARPSPLALPIARTTIMFPTRTRTLTTTSTATTTSPGPKPSLFCFAIARAKSYEMDIMLMQCAKGIGIFACNDQAVLSTVGVDLGNGVHTLIFPGAKVGTSKDGTAANTQVFLNAWHRLYAEQRVQTSDYTVKVDPDTVLLPDRLRVRLAPHTTPNAIFFPNCNKFPTAPDYPVMYGALEILSKTAVMSYVVGGDARCKRELPGWTTWGEDLFLTKCLRHIGVGPVKDEHALQDARCWGVNCLDKQAAAFHDFKSVGSWFGCWRQVNSTPTLTLPPKSTSTSKPLWHPPTTTTSTREPTSTRELWQPLPAG